MPRGNQFGTAESANEARASLLAEWEAKRGKKSLGNQGKESDRKARPVEPLKPQGYMPDRARKSKDNVRDNAATEIRPSQIRPAPRNNRRYDRAAGAAPESARVRVAPPIAEKLARPAPRRKANRTKKRVLPSIIILAPSTETAPQWTCPQIDRQIDRQTDRQIDRHSRL